VYADANYGGVSHTYTVTGTCNTVITSEFNDQTSSLKLTSGCVEMFGSTDCTGGSKQYTANTASLTADGFDNSFSSFRSCSSMSVYADPNYGGVSQTRAVTGTCNNDLASIFNDQTSSLQLSGCVQLFADYGCTGVSRQYTGNVANLSADGFDNSLTSFRECSSFTVYDSVNYGGVSQTYAVTSTCNNALYMTDNFNDMASSIQVTGCVKLFADGGCSGVSHQYTGNVANFTADAFDNSASSFRAC